MYEGLHGEGSWNSDAEEIVGNGLGIVAAEISEECRVSQAEFQGTALGVAEVCWGTHGEESRKADAEEIVDAIVRHWPSKG